MIKVLNIDDDEIVLLVHKKLLQRCGIKTEIKSFKGGKKALEYLEKSGGEEILILLDINMPGMDGWNFLNHLDNSQICDNCHVILTTATVDDQVKVTAANYERVIGVFEKPLTLKSCEKLKSIFPLMEFF